MRGSVFAARPASSLRQLLHRQPRRMFASPPIKDTKPPAPIEPSKEQAHPIGAYYESILHKPQPIPAEKPEAPPASSAKAPEPAAPTPTPAAPTPAKRGRKPKAAAPPADDKAKSVSSPEPSSSSSSSSPPLDDSNDVQARASVVFSSPLVGPAERAERLAAIRTRSRLVAGVLVPPKPEEPDNCCMSGCVNCVWDRFRDDMEGWAMANAEAERRLAAQETGVEVAEASMAAQTELKVGEHEVDAQGAVSVEDDGGGSASNWDKPSSAKKIAKDFWDEDLYQNVPVGIREFMKQEKRLKEKHLRERTSGG